MLKVQEQVCNMYSDLILKKEKIIKDALAEKGYPMPDLNQRFPKIACVHQDIWEMYFYDNGTPDGDFVVAFYKPELTFLEGNFSYTITANIKWTTIYPSPILKTTF